MCVGTGAIFFDLQELLNEFRLSRPSDESVGSSLDDALCLDEEDEVRTFLVVLSSFGSIQRKNHRIVEEEETVFGPSAGSAPAEDADAAVYAVCEAELDLGASEPLSAEDCSLFE